MAQETTFSVNYREVEVDDKTRELFEKRCRGLGEEFPETTRIEVTVEPEGDGVRAHAHVTGRQTDVAAHADADEVRTVADRLFDRVERQLRRNHDKVIFTRRRAAQRGRRGGPEE